MTVSSIIAASDSRMGYSPARRAFMRLSQSKAFAITVVVVAIVAIWYAFAVYLNTPWQLTVYERGDVQWTAADLVRDTLAQERPVLPAPHQVLVEIWNTTVTMNPASRRSLLFHSWVTLSSTLLGFVIGTLLGMLLAVGIVHNRAMEKSVMPWVIASQTIPILAVAPMIIVVLN